MEVDGLRNLDAGSRDSQSHVGSPSEQEEAPHQDGDLNSLQSSAAEELQEARFNLGYQIGTETLQFDSPRYRG